MLAAWRGLSNFEHRSSLRTWLYRIATNRCLNVLRDAGRRPQPVPAVPFEIPAPTRMSDPGWLEPYPDDRLGWLADSQPGPEARYESREAIELAFISALQRLPGRQRAVLVLRDVLGFHAAEAAAMLETSVEAVKSALKRARATIGQQLGDPVQPVAPPSPASASGRAAGSPGIPGPLEWRRQLGLPGDRTVGLARGLPGVLRAQHHAEFPARDRAPASGILRAEPGDQARTLTSRRQAGPRRSPRPRRAGQACRIPARPHRERPPL